MKIPPGLEQYSTIMDELSISELVSYMHNGIKYNGIDFKWHSPEIAFIFLYNDDREKFDKLVAPMIRWYGKTCYNSLIHLIIDYKMDISLLSEFWREKSSRVTVTLISKLYDNIPATEFFLNDPKFFRSLGSMDISDISESYFKFNDLMLSNTKIKKWITNIYITTGRMEEFLSSDIKDIFLF